MLKLMTQDIRLDPKLDLQIVAKSTPGYVPADLDSLLRKAGILAVQRFTGIDHLDDAQNTQTTLETL